MKLLKPLFATLILIQIGCFSLIAQKNVTQDADNAYKFQQYYDAIDLYKKAYSKLKKNPVESNRVLYQLAECYRKVNDMKNAEAQYRRLEKLEYYKNESKIMLYLGDALKINEKYEEALIAYNKYKELESSDPRGEVGAQSCILAQQWLDDPTRYEIKNEKKFNSRDNEWSPFFSDKKYRSLTFTSSREGSKGKGTDAWTGQSFSDLYVVIRDKKDNWSTPVLFDEEETVNSESNEGEAYFTKSGNTIYFTRCGNIKKEQAGCMIYVAKRKGRGWGDVEPVMFSGVDTSSYDLMHPTLSDNELTIYFTSNIPGGQGGYDLWTANRQRKTKPFGAPTNLGKLVNTKANEAFPYLRYDSVLYYSTNGLPGLGGMDIFKTVKIGEKWGEPKNLQAPLNSNADDFGIIFFPRKEKGYLSSNRKGGRGGDDIYSFELPPLIFTLAGTIKNEKTLQLIPGALIKLVGSDGTNIEAQTDLKGYYKFDKTQIIPAVTYNMTVSKKDFFSTTGTETTVGLKKNTDLIHDFMLTPIPKDPIVLPEIRYDLAQWDLKTQYQDSLIDLIQTLIKNPTIVIELRAHTDSRPIPMTNDTLSQRRAQSVVDYLIERGIDRLRLVAKGYGQTYPRKLEKNISISFKNKDYVFYKDTVLTDAYIATLKTVDEKEAAHQLNRRTEFIILRDDFVPSAKNDSLNVGIQIVQNANNSVKYTLGTENTQIIPCVVNGVSSHFTIAKTAENITITNALVMKFLSEARISKDDFFQKERAFNNDGTIIEKSNLIIKTLKIGDKSLAEIEVIVTNDQAQDLIFPESVLIELMGAYSFDNVKKEIIFNK